MPTARRRIAWPLAALCLFACARAEPGETGAAPARNALILSIDTLRADHLGAYGHARPTSPNLDRLAADGVLFEDAGSTAPWTLPAHASLLTGLYPVRHGVRTNVQGLAADVPTLAAWLGERGFETGAFVNSYFLEERFGLGRGFDTYVAFPEDQSRTGATPEILAAAEAWLAERGERRFVLFVHLFDVHSDYRSLPEHERRFVRGPGRYDGSTIQIMRGLVGDLPLEPADAERLAALYDAGIHQVDQQLAGFLSRLRRGRLADTLVVVTSDHGEEFLEHGGLVHGNTHYQEQLHVPLLFAGAGLPQGLRVAAPVSLVDVLPTLLDGLGVEPPPHLDGESLRPLWEGAKPAAERVLLAETGPMKEDALRSLRRGRYKLVHDTRSGERALYDLIADPGETRDASGEHPELARTLAEALDERMQDPRPPHVIGTPGEAERARLRALGYLEP